MPHFDQASAECLVLTYKEGLLSAIAHDLEILVTRFDVDLDAECRSIEARFDAASLRVISAVRSGVPDAAALSASDKRKIEHSIADEVLASAKHPSVSFVSTRVTPEDGGYRIEGRLTIRGRTQPIAFTTRPEAGYQVAEVTIHQPDFGIKPFSAMMGTLKIKPDVRVRISIPAQGENSTFTRVPGAK